MTTTYVGRKDVDEVVSTLLHHRESPLHNDSLAMTGDLVRQTPNHLLVFQLSSVTIERYHGSIHPASSIQRNSAIELDHLEREKKGQ